MDVKKIKQDFKIFERMPNGKRIVYLDSAATSLKPKSVVEAVNEYYEKYTANVFRGIYRLSEEATEAYEGAREKVARFVFAKPNEMIFVRNTTEAVNLVMHTWGKENIKKGDEVVTTVMEHHANLVPWQVLCKEVGAKLKFVQLKEDGSLNLDSLSGVLSNKTKLVCLTHVSNVLGVINPIKKIVTQIKNYRSTIKVLVDGAQAVPHMKIDVNVLGCDFYVFSGHKMLGPTGVGVLWAKEVLLKKMSPFLYGGEMIKEVRLNSSTWNDIPHKFEAGTPHIAGVIGLGRAVDYLENLGMEWVRGHEKKLVKYAINAIQKRKEIKVIGPTNINLRGGVISFVCEGVHPHDVAQILDEDNVYIRAGHHCAMPLHKYLKVPATARMSFYVYNSESDIDKLMEGLERVKRKFKK